MDIIEFLEEQNIRLWHSGKNVAKGWIGLQCIYCDDSSNHLGIRLSDLKCNCWKCGGHNIVYLLRDLTGTSIKSARSLVKQFAPAKVPPIPTYTAVDRRFSPKYLLPKESTPKLPKAHKHFLYRRRFSPALTARAYELRAVGNLGDYKFRLIIPIYHRRILVSFTTRAIYSSMAPKYYHAQRRHRMMSPNKLVYNIDSIPIGHDAILLEGCMDVWRWNGGGIACFGQALHKHQYLAIKRAKIRNLYIMYDSDKLIGRKYKQNQGFDRDVDQINQMSKYRAVETWRVLHPLVDKCELITNERAKDIARLRDSQVQRIKAQLDFNKGL